MVTMLVNHAMTEGMMNFPSVKTQVKLMLTNHAMTEGMMKSPSVKTQGSLRNRKLMFKFQSWWGEGA